MVLFLIGAARLFWLRFDAGDLYPPYSSLRSDPLGVEVLYESLAALEGQFVHRNFRPFRQAAFEPGATFFVCGLSPDPAPPKSRRWEPLLDAVAENGGRLVFAFTTTMTQKEAGSADKKEGKDSGETEARVEETSEEKTGVGGLGFEFNRRNTGDKPSVEEAVLIVSRETAGLPETIVWRSNLSFELTDPAWRAVFSFEDEPVVAVRPWGGGEIVLVADSYPFSNEALRSHRSSGFLAWAVRSDGPVVFDEFHHGLARDPGIAALIRKYRLQGLVLSLAVLVILLVWRHSASFVPMPAAPEDIEQEDDPGPDTAEGWVNLMKRHIRAEDLPAVCLEAWDASAAAGKVPKEKAERVRSAVARYTETQNRQDPVAVYRSICEMIKQGKKP